LLLAIELANAGARAACAMCVDGRIVFPQLTQHHVTEICVTSINETATAALGSFSTSNAGSELLPDYTIICMNKWNFSA